MTALALLLPAKHKRSWLIYFRNNKTHALFAVK